MRGIGFARHSNQYFFSPNIVQRFPWAIAVGKSIACRWLLSTAAIGVARILSAGVHFFTTQQKILKIDSCSGWGVHFVSCGGALTHFPCKLGLKKIFFTALGGCRCTHCTPPGYAYDCSCSCLSKHCLLQLCVHNSQTATNVSE